MYYDGNGNPDPNGDYQKIDGKLVVRPGGRVHFDLSIRDTSSRSRSVFLTDHSLSTNEINRQALKLMRDARYQFSADAPVFSQREAAKSLRAPAFHVGNGSPSSSTAALRALRYC